MTGLATGARMRSYFEGKVALVVGGSSGIGLAVGRLMAAHGAHVVLAGRSAERLDAAAESVALAGGRGDIVVTDVREPESVARAVDFAIDRGGLDILYNGAGVGLAAFAEDTSLAHWQETILVNLMGVVHGVAAAYPRMERRGSGQIVNVSSLLGLLPLPASAAYGAAKYGVVGLSHCLRLEAARRGIRVNVVCPAAVDTPIFERSHFVGLDRERVLAHRPGTIQTPEACARDILRGMRADRATITPGAAASGMWRLARHFPSLWGLLARRITEQFAAAHLPAPRHDDASSASGPGTPSGG
jgi:NAD(P)-dependent dehydrogenase (short-subunit alcohol dehydrogenase family)